MTYGNTIGHCKLCKRTRPLEGGVCIDCNRDPDLHRGSTCEVTIRAVITNRDTIEAIKETLGELAEVHKIHPHLGIGELHDRLATLFGELESEPA